MNKKNEYLISVDEFETRCKALARILKKNKNIKNIYGVMCSGMFIAIRLSYLTKLPITVFPKSNETAIIDDILDTGNTRHSFDNFGYFFPLVDKQAEGIINWVKFWYEQNER